MVIVHQQGPSPVGCPVSDRKWIMMSRSLRLNSGVSLLGFLKICVLSSIGCKLWLIEDTRAIF